MIISSVRCEETYFISMDSMDFINMIHHLAGTLFDGH